MKVKIVGIESALMGNRLGCEMAVLSAAVLAAVTLIVGYGNAMAQGKQATALAFQQLQRVTVTFCTGITIFLQIAISLIFPTPAKAEMPVRRGMEILWSVPHFPMGKLAQSPDGAISVLSEDREGKHDSLILGTNASGPGRSISLPIRQDLDFPLATMISSADGTLWIGGAVNGRRGTFSEVLSDAYVAKIDKTGSVAWERQFGRSTEMAVQDLVALPSQGIAIVGVSEGKTWLARISEDGSIVWEKALGVAGLASVAIVDGSIIVAAFEATNAQARSPVHAAVWRFDEAGNLVDQHAISPDSERPSLFELMEVIPDPSDDQYYVFSAWEVGTQQKPTVVTKMTNQDSPLWHQELPETTYPDRYHPYFCFPAIAVLRNGDAIVSCADDDGAHFSQLDSTTGSVQRSVVPTSQKPNCDDPATRPRFLVRRPDAELWMFGSGPGCTWVGRVQLTKSTIK